MRRSDKISDEVLSDKVLRDKVVITFVLIKFRDKVFPCPNKGVFVRALPELLLFVLRTPVFCLHTHTHTHTHVHNIITRLKKIHFARERERERESARESVWNVITRTKNTFCA